ncbi:MAG TPA: hypothetical protein VFW98_07795 [Gemmatimonadaceae bacterium]|nr:hypothetical protein [Gemmatimonadaceae bacterium]
MSMPIAVLRQQLAQVLRPPIPDTMGGLATGVESLDAILPARGLPRGRLTEVLGARGSGKTTLLRQVVDQTAGHGLWAAYVDARRTLAPGDWARACRSAHGVWMVRPRAAGAGAWCADVLLRSGAFALVILDGAPPLTRQVAVRLTRLARDADAAFVVAAEDERSATMLGGALRLRVERARRPGTRITVEKGGIHRTIEVSYAISVARCLCTHPEVPDRRGVARSRARSASTCKPPAG